MLTKADDYPIHQTADPIAYAGTDRNFYDRYFFNGYSIDGEIFFASALGVYPHLNIMDAAFAIRIGDMQYNLHASRHLNMERMDTQVGPIRVEVVEPLKRLRVIVDDKDHGISADILFEGRTPPVEEPRAIRRSGPRTTSDFTRLTQLGRYTGWVRAGGREIQLNDRQVEGVRDRSWGVRPIGARDPQSMVPPEEPQFHWLWVPAQLEDRAFLFFLNEDGRGEAWNLGMAVLHDDGRVEHLEGASMDISYMPATRWPSRGVITVPSGPGVYTIDLEPGPRFFMTGLGYMNPEWSHGINKGPLAVGYDEIRITDIPGYVPPFTYTQAFTRATMTTPEQQVIRGHGTFEALSFGPHAGLGFKAAHDGA